MKTLNILTTGAFATLLLLGSCTKDVDNSNPQGGGGEGGVVEGIPTYATISLSQRAGAGTYAAEDGGDEGEDQGKPEDDYVNGDGENSQASDAERKITRASVLVFNSNDILENYVEFNATDLAANPVAKRFATTTGQKRLYALANLPDANRQEIKDIFNGTNGHTAADKKLSHISEIVQKIEEIADATKDNEFWMSNVYKLGATLEDQVTVQNIQDSTAVDGGTGPNENNFTIYIGRMVSKVTPSFADDLVVNSGDGTIDKDGATYRVRNNPTRFYTFPVYKDVQLVSPYYELEYNLAGGAEVYPEKLNAVDFFCNGDAAAHDADGEPEEGATFSAMKTASYLTENSPKDATRHKVTFLSIKAKWTPDDNAIYLNADGTVNTDGTVKTAIEGNQGTFYRVQKWQGGKILGYCPGIYAQTPTKWTEVGGTPGDAEGSLSEGNTTLYQETQRDQAKASEDACYLIVKYDKGMAYWAYWMRSRLDGTIAEKYALKRNNHFKVDIISVDGMGDPNPDDNLDKEEDLEADASMKATIEVLNWNVVDIEGGI